MIKTVLLLTGLVLVQARSNNDAVVNARQPGNRDDCETLANGCPADFTIHKLLPHEKYCHMFYYCDNGELALRSCDEPLYFDSELQICVRSWETDCVNDGPYTYPTTLAPEIGTTPGDIGDVLQNGCPADFDIQYLLPHEECEKYYQCDNGEKTERDCQPGTVFNFDIQACDWPYNVARCEGSPGATARPPAPDSSDEVQVPDAQESDWEALPNGCPADYQIDYQLPHESDCSNYYTCDNGELFGMECPPGLHFSPSQQICTWPSEAGCEHWTGPGGCGSPLEDNNQGCTGSQKIADTLILKSAKPELQEEWEALPNGCPSNYSIDYLLPHEYDCEKFYYCVHGEKVEFSCTNGTHFSSALQRCAWPEEAGCENRDSSGPVLVPVVEGTTTLHPDCPECPPWPVNPADRCKDGCNVAPWPHPECDKFYFCVGDQSRLGICAEGLHFNPRTLTCDIICNAGCARIIPQITRHADGLLTFVPNAWGNIAEVMDKIEKELKAGL